MSEDLREKLWSIAAERPSSQYEADKCADHLFEIVDTERRRYAIEQLEKLLENSDHLACELPGGYEVVLMRDISEVITRLNGEHDQPNN